MAADNLTSRAVAQAPVWPDDTLPGAEAPRRRNRKDLNGAPAQAPPEGAPAQAPAAGAPEPTEFKGAPAVTPVLRPDDQSEFNRIMDNTVTTPGTEKPLPESGDDSDMELAPVPPEINDHNKNKTMRLGPLHVGELLQIASLGPVRLEASYNQPLTLRAALNYALRNSLPIRINEQTFQFQKYYFLGALAGFLPTYATDLKYGHTSNNPESASNPVSDSRLYDNIIDFPVFQGGRVVWSSALQYYRMQATRHQFQTSINDTLLNVYNAYYNAVLQRALVQIRIKSVEVSQLQLEMNEELYRSGTGTQFAIMQSRTQLALDRQALLNQEVASRLAALQLAYSMNVPLLANPIPLEGAVNEASLLDEAVGIDDLLNVALDHRPELRQYEMLRLSARRGVGLAAASLYPTANWSIVQSNTSTSSPDVASSRVQSMAYTFDLNWTLTNLGATAAANVTSFNTIARQSLLQANQVLMIVTQQLRSSYLNALAARTEIDVTAKGTAAAAEALRMSNLRLQEGVGTNLELIEAQRDYIQSLINQAQAIIASDQAQAQVLHDMGVISVDTLTNGYRRRVSTADSITK